jgi:hypothetical protein
LKPAQSDPKGIAMAFTCPPLRVTMVRRLAGLAGLTIAALAAGPAAAWNAAGHESVGGIADQLISGTPTAKQVTAILGGSLQNAAIWADCAKSVKQVNSVWTFDKADQWRAKDCELFAADANNKAMIAFVSRNSTVCEAQASHGKCGHTHFHFSDISVAQPHYDPALPGASRIDLLHAITAAAAVLKSGEASAKSPAPFNISGQREALRLLAHYIGDLHQPLHVGAIYLNDAGQPIDPATQADADAHDNAGGNALLLEGSKLHELWDKVTSAQRTLALDGSGAAAARLLPAPSGSAGTWPLAWANDTLGVARQAFAPLKFGAKTPGIKPDQWPATAPAPTYKNTRETLQREQIVKAGAHLARLLTALLP